MARLIHVAIGDARIVHDKAVICKEGSPYMNNVDAICGVCAFAGENCSDIACTPSDRDDKNFVYFQPIESK